MKFRKYPKSFVFFIILFLTLSLSFSDLIRQIFLIPEPEKVSALNKISNWDFNGSATGWTGTNDDGTDVCGSTTSSTGDVAYSTLGYSSGVYQAVTPASKNSNYRAKVTSSFTAPGSGSVNVYGKLTYTAASTSFSTADTSWIRLDVYNSTDTTYVGNLFCLSFNTAQSATSSYGSTVTLTGGTTYVVRATMRVRLGSTNNSVATLTVDNIDVNSAPTGLAASAPAGTPDAQLDWTASTAGTGALGLHASTPYKVYRDGSSPVSTFLANATTNSYTDTSTAGNTIYYYALTDYDTGSNLSPNSSEVSVLTRPDTPGTPTFTLIKDTTLRVNWTAPTGGATSYKVERCSGTGCSSFSQITSGETDTYYDDSGLSAGSTYRYRVRGTNATGDGAYSSSSADVTTYVISVTITANDTVSYGSVSAGGSKSTIDLSTTPRATYTGTATIDLYIKSSDATNGTGWTLGSSAGENIFVHEFSTNAGGLWTKFVDSSTYSELATGLTNDDYQDFDLRITTPTVSDSVQKSITVTVMVSIPD